MVPLSLAPDHQGALFRCHTVYPLTQVLSQDILPFFFDNFIHTQHDHKHSQFPLSLIILLLTPLFSNPSYIHVPFMHARSGVGGHNCCVFY